MRDLPVVALDFNSENHVLDSLDQFDEPLFVKVGMELYYQTGPALIKKIKERGHDMFLDLKLHDIPNTVQEAMEGLDRSSADLVNVYAAGGTEMMKHAVKGLRKYSEATKIIAVAQSTSTIEETLHQEQNVQAPIEETVLNYVELAQESGLDGVACSPSEAKLLTKSLGSEFLKVTPGIRPKGAAANDQKRIITPEDAKQLGSTHIVVGRPITQSEHPQESCTKVKESRLG